MKNQALFPPNDLRSPWAWLYQECSGKKIGKPRRKAAKHLYADEIGAHLTATTNEFMTSAPPGTKRVDVWQRFLGSKWNALPDEEKQTYQMKSNANYETEMKEYETLQSKFQSKKRYETEDPEEMQRFVRQAMSSTGWSAQRTHHRHLESLTSFVEPILQCICEITGLEALFLLGGPEPAKGGQLSAFR
jgi:hypothetical protein